MGNPQSSTSMPLRKAVVKAQRLYGNAELNEFSKLGFGRYSLDPVPSDEQNIPKGRVNFELSLRFQTYSSSMLRTA